ncbi:phosphate acyltransferase PlsX [Thermobrachium celere]|uniref:Phosphate acyltransferase n=1 Tax=Thermobrachium celere DSM 8682 TaxID=941824 RepID=R7RNY6_9CLOT|nr:phosphate acyltransferase PlsX [Thermobrachium celere]CDF57912.1 Phosphate:acyl-ACP acyltransferase PlsX [Thermobrachium celere DSM 8682]
MKVVIDAMGGDKAPYEIIKGAVDAARELNVDLILVGKQEIIQEELKKHNIDGLNIEVVNATEIIENNESPTMAIRRKKDSSLVVAFKLLKEGKADALVSAGSTGAILAGGIFLLGRINGIDRAALTPVIPGKNGPFVIVDAGANADCKPNNLLQFALMGEVYANKVLGINNPKVALANIGAEEEKGNELTKQSYGILKENIKGFVGNIEGRDIPNGDVQVVVCDGFTGNMILKVYEGVAATIFDILKSEIMSSTMTKIGGMLLKPVFKKFKRKFDYTEYGGAILLGVEGLVIKAHGSSNAKAFKNAIRQAKNAFDGKILQDIKEELNRINRE